MTFLLGLGTGNGIRTPCSFLSRRSASTTCAATVLLVFNGLQGSFETHSPSFLIRDRIDDAYYSTQNGFNPCCSSLVLPPALCQKLVDLKPKQKLTSRRHGSLPFFRRGYWYPRIPYGIAELLRVELFW